MVPERNLSEKNRKAEKKTGAQSSRPSHSLLRTRELVREANAALISSGTR